MKFVKVLICLVMIISICAGAVYYKFQTVENEVAAFLVSEGMEANSFETKPFLANLPKERNWMVGVEVENDPKTYYYYLNNDGKIVLESVVEDGMEYVIMNVMN